MMPNANNNFSKSYDWKNFVPRDMSKDEKLHHLISYETIKINLFYYKIVDCLNISFFKIAPKRSSSY